MDITGIQLGINLYGGPNMSVPSGVIALWKGSIATIPAGWLLCNGANGTPDLRDKFIVGAITDASCVAKTCLTGSLTQSGGSTCHCHSISGCTQCACECLNNCTSLFCTCSASASALTCTYPSGHYHCLSCVASGSSTHYPPYYALAYIMKS